MSDENRRAIPRCGVRHGQEDHHEPNARLEPGRADASRTIHCHLPGIRPVRQNGPGSGPREQSPDTRFDMR